MRTMMIQRIPPENTRTIQDFKILRTQTLSKETFSVTAFKKRKRKKKKKKLGNEHTVDICK